MRIVDFFLNSLSTLLWAIENSWKNGRNQLLAALAIPAVFWCAWNGFGGTIPLGIPIPGTSWLLSRSWDMVGMLLIMLLLFVLANLLDKLDAGKFHKPIEDVAVMPVTLGCIISTISGLMYFLAPPYGWWLALKYFALLLAGGLFLAITCGGKFVYLTIDIFEKKLPTIPQRIGVAIFLLFGSVGGWILSLGLSSFGLMWAVLPWLIFLMAWYGVLAGLCAVVRIMMKKAPTSSTRPASV
jgi:hypothetical protein